MAKYEYLDIPEGSIKFTLSMPTFKNNPMHKFFRVLKLTRSDYVTLM